MSGKEPDINWKQKKKNIWRIPEKEKPKIYKEVFDKQTVNTVWKLIRKKVIDGLDHVVSTGKEGNVFKAWKGEEPRACKIYRYETSSFRSLSKYIQGDKRFEKISPRRRDLVKTWCQKEYKNLVLAEEAGCRTPRPYKAMNNVLVMQFIGDKTSAPLLKDCELEDYEKVFWMVCEDLKKLYSQELVHADVSEFNIMMWEGNPFLIDIGQGVLLSHPHAEEFLERDVENLLKYFKKKGVRAEKEKVLEYITS